MQTSQWLLKTGTLLVLGVCLAGGELVRAGQTSALPVVDIPAELPPRTAPYELDPELHAFLARAQRLSWTVGGDHGGLGRAIQIQDPSGRVNGLDAQGQIQTPLPDSTYATYAPFKVSGEGGLVGTVRYGEPVTLVVWGKGQGVGVILHVYRDLPPVSRRADVEWEQLFLQYHADLPPELASNTEAVAWLPLPAGPWTTLPAMYVDYDGDQQIDAVVEPRWPGYRKRTLPALQQVGLPAVLPPRKKPTRIPVEQDERVLSGWRAPPAIKVSPATRVILQRRSGWVHGVDEQGRSWNSSIPGPPYMSMGGNLYTGVEDPEECESVEIQPMETGKVAMLMGPLYLVPPDSAFKDQEDRIAAFMTSEVLEVWYGPVAVSPASVLWLVLPPFPWEHFPALYLDRDGDQVVDEVIEAQVEIRPYQERTGSDEVRRIL